MFSLATAVYAQYSSQDNSQGTQNSGTQDCSDPLLATTPECAGQLQQGTSSQGSQQMRIPGASLGEQTPSANGNYSDIDQSQRTYTGRSQLQPPLPPEPLTEFQKFIASTTGQVLPVYGADLFRRVPSTFAPLDATPVPADYVVGPGDELRIHVWGQVNFQSALRVDRSGDVFLPQVGPVHVAGMAFSALDAHLREAVGRIYHNFDLTVDVGRIRAIQVYLAGQARRPGVYTVSSLSTLADTLFASGGPSVQGSMRHIELRRGGTVVTDFDLYDLLIRGDKSKDAKLQSDDVIFIPPVGHQVAVTGSVRNPAIYELRGDETLQQVLASAGGVTTIAAESRVSIERIQEHHDRQAMELAYDASGLATPLVDGDLVRVFPIVARYQKTVTLRGNTANPGRFSWHAGMHVSELIPDKDSLLTRNYWWRRTQLGLPAPEFEPIPGFENLRQPTDNHAVSVERSLEEGRMAANREARLQGQAGNETTAQAAQPQTQPAAGQQGQTGNSGDDQNTQDQMQQGSMGSGTGAAQHAGSASIAETQNAMNNPLSPFGQKTDVKALAPEIDWDYAVVERLNPDTLKTVLIPFDLGKLVLEHDSSQDLELQAADIVSIFSGADIRLPLAHQTKFVRLDGEVAHAGVYTVQPGETLRQLVERAGGVTSNAYLYGSEFTRESTRAIQQARIDEYARTLGLQIQRRNLATEPPPTQAPGATQTVPVEPDLIASLRRIRATGRIVLNFNPQQSGTSSIPELTLEDGDRFSIPPVPATVNVVGAVYDQNSFLFNRERKTGTYLRLAGGANRDADRGREFIIRADGEVVSRARSRSLWSGDEFNHLDINPGDTIVVPDKTYKPSLWNSVLSSASTLGSFAVDAAILTTIQ